VLRRGTFDSYRGRAVVSDALERAQTLLAEHEVTPLADDVQAAIEDIMAAFRRGAA
jgi:hypothetical protein